MSKAQSLSLFLLRVAMGCLYFYAGITKVLDSSWSAAGYIKNAHSLQGFYQIMLNPQALMIVNFMVKWGLLFLGISLLLGLFVRLSGYLGMLLMLLLYLPILNFPHVGAMAYVVDEHIVYILALWVLVQFQAGHIWGLDRWVVLRK